MTVPVNNKIMVSVNMKQKDEMKIGGITIKVGLKFENNYREKSPVIARVEQSDKYLKEGDLIVCHHNHYYPPSPYFLYECYYSIPINHTIFAIIREDGSLTPVYGNIFGERIDIESDIILPIDQRKKYTDRIRITQSSNPNYKEGQIIFTRPSAPYDIVYNVEGVVRKVTKVWDQMVCGVLK
jgi:hypothetical protein